VLWVQRGQEEAGRRKEGARLEMANKPVPVGITRTRPRFDGESPL